MGSGAVVFAVWGYVISKTVSGEVELNPRLISVLIGCTHEEVEAAIEYLCQPDADSRNTEQDGRRLVKNGTFSYDVVSHAIYNRMRNTDDRREYNRKKQAEYRAAKKESVKSVQRVPQSAHTEAEAEAEAEETEASASCSEPSPEVSKPEPGSGIKIPVVGTNAKYYDIPQSKLEEWSQAFPGIDVPAQCRKAAQWCRDNPAKRKTLKGVNRFLNTWLSREQDAPKLNGHTKTNGHYPEEFMLICSTSQQYRDDIPKRKEILGPRLFSIAKRLGIQNIIDAIGNDWKMKSLVQFYNQYSSEV